MRQHLYQEVWLFSQEEGTCIVFCVQQHPCLKFGLCSQMREIGNVCVVQQHYWPRLVLFHWKRKMWDIAKLLQNLFLSFVWRIISACFFIWAGDRVLRTFAICIKLLPYFSHFCINILCLFSVHLPLFIVLFRKLTGATCTDLKEVGIWKQIALASYCYAQRPMQCLTDNERKAKSKW